MKNLPRSKNALGYSDDELKSICKKLKVDFDKFCIAMGVNTCALVDGKTLWYKCDVERALYKLGHRLGIFHEWD